MIPFLSLFIALIQLKSGSRLIDHTVHAFHFMTFFLILFLLVAGVTNLISWAFVAHFPGLNRWLFPVSLFGLLLLLMLYWVLSFRRLGADHWLICILKSFGMTIGFFMLFLLYINILLLWTIFNVS